MKTSIEHIYNNHFEELHRYAFTILKDSHLAEDTVQDCFIIFSLELKKGNRILNPRAYLFKMVYHKSIQTNRSRARSIVNEEPCNYEFITNNNQETQIIKKENNLEQQQIMERILALMPAQCKAVFLKSKLEQKKYREIAVDLDISEKTVEAHMSKALKIIREFIRVNCAAFALILAIINNEWN